jgi:prepilin-type N-terminal cleavage/methylation domain-containing protein
LAQLRSIFGFVVNEKPTVLKKGGPQPGAIAAPTTREPGRFVRRSRQGFTLTETLIVVVMVGALTMFALPKFSKLVESNKLSAAREEITSAIATARAAAVQKGRVATLRFSGNKMWVTVVTNDAGATMTVVPIKSLRTLYNVSIVANDSVITYDMRGFASPRLASTGVFLIQSTTKKDSVCITPAGQIMPRGCQL